MLDRLIPRDQEFFGFFNQLAHHLVKTAQLLEGLFADPERVRAILAAAGFTAIEVAPHDARIGGGSLDQAVELAFKVGPLGTVLRQNPELRARVEAPVRAALAPYETPSGMQMPAAVWIVQARNG